MFAQAGESVLVQLFTNHMSPFPMIICVAALGVSVALAGIAREIIRDRRKQLLRHEERMAMIDAGLHPDFPPEETVEGEKSELEQTLEYQDQA